MRPVTLCFLMKENPNRQVCLGMKKRGFGADKFNGFGGKLDEAEGILKGAVRELGEECGVSALPKDLTKVGEMEYTFPLKPEWDQLVHIFLVENWIGEPEETEEMRPEWFGVDKLPFDQMWQNDTKWLPLILEKKKIKGRVTFNPDNESTKEMLLEEVKELR